MSTFSGLRRKVCVLMVISTLLALLLLLPTCQARKRHGHGQGQGHGQGRGQNRGRGQGQGQGRGQGQWRRGSDPPRPRRLPDPNFLLIPGVLKAMEDKGLIFRDTRPDLRWIVERIDHSRHLDHSCPEVVYATLVLARDPPVRFHRTCDAPGLWAARRPPVPCRTSAVGRRHTDRCQPQTAFHVVRVGGRERYQETFTGCVCSASKPLAA